MTLSSAGSPIAENGGTATISATLSAISGLPVTVNLVYSGAAVNITDYTRTSSSIVIPAGVLTANDVTLTGVDDAINEGAENIVVEIDTVTNGTESGVQTQSVTITDDDAAPTVTLSSVGSPIAENGGTATISATLSAISGLPVTVNLVYSGAAVNITDYTRTSSIDCNTRWSTNCK